MTPGEKQNLVDRIYKKQWEEITHWMSEYSCGWQSKNVMMCHIDVGDCIEYTVIYSADDNDGVLIRTSCDAPTVQESHREMCLEGKVIAKIAELHALHIKTKDKQ